MEINISQLKVYGGQVTSAQFNALVDALQAVTLQKGVGYSLSRNVTGTTLRGITASVGASPCPFDVTVATVDGTTTAKLLAGTVNGLLPDNNFDSFTIDPTEVILVKANCTSDGTKITAVTLEIDDTAITPQTPTPFALPAAVSVLLAVIVAGVPYRVFPCGSVVLVGQEQFRTDKATPEPGTLTYEPYYSWVPQVTVWA